MAQYQRETQNKDDHQHNEHVTPLRVYLNVAAALFGLTILTVVAHNMHLGAFGPPVAFLIATVKAVLVMLWFMHLKHESTTNRVVFGCGFFFLMLLFFFTVLDIWTRAVETSSL